MTVDQGIQLAVAIGTIAVAVLAIWGDRVRQWLGLGPRLNLALPDPSGEPGVIREGDGTTTPARYYHLRVSNSHRWTQATNVRVVVVGLARPAADGSLVAQPLIGSLQLMWRFSSYHATFSIVGPDDFCDLGYLKYGEHFRLTPYVSPNDFAGSVSANERMQVELKALADNAESPSLCVEVSWDGKWSEDTIEMGRHLVVKEVNCSQSRQITRSP